MKVTKETMLAMREIFLKVAAEDTAYNKNTYNLNKDKCPLTGHCFMVAKYIQEYFGGYIRRHRIGKERHYWNYIPELGEFDLTGSQYTGDGWTPIPELAINSETTKACITASCVLERYERFVERVDKERGLI